MSRIKSWAARAAHSLSHHLDRLHDTLNRLHGRLREAVAEAVSGGTADAVRDAVLAAMLAPEAAPAYASPNYGSSSRPYDQSRCRDGPYWEDDPYRPSWEQDPYGDDPDHYEPDELDDERREPARPSPQCLGRRVGQAVAVGCQAAAWWLRRKVAGRYVALAAIGVGAAAVATAYFFGPVVAAIAALAACTSRLTAIADAARYGAAVLFGVRPS